MTAQPLECEDDIEITDAQLAASDTVTRRGRLTAGLTADCYRVESTSARSLTVTLTSTEFDTYLRLFEDGVDDPVFEDDDGGGGTNSRFEYDFEGGKTYLIEVGSYGAYEEGSYVLTLAADAGPGVQFPKPRLYNTLKDLVGDERRAGSGVCKPSPLPASVDPLDIPHPTAFIRIVERTQDLDRFVLYDPKEDPGPRTRDVYSRNLGEVDRRSTIVIEFDRGFLQDSIGHSNLDVSISAFLGAGTEGKEIAVLGYRTLGEDAKPASARVGSAAALLAQLCAMGRQAVDLVQLYPRDSDPQARQLRRTELAARSSLLKRWETVFAPFLARDDRTLRSLGDVARSTPERFRATVQGLQESGIALRDFKRVERNDQKSLTDASALFENLNVSIDQLAQQLSILSTTLTAAQGTEALAAAMMVLQSAGPGQDTLPLVEIEKQLTKLMLPNLRDAEIALGAERLKANDVLTIKVFNVADADSSGRTMSFELDVVSFGLPPRPKISDSFFFVTRLGVHEDDQLFFNTSPDDLPTDLQSEVEAPKASRGRPTPGASALWTWYPRGDGWWQPIARFLNPGFGLNVSFPSFGTTVTTLRPTGPEDDRRIEVKKEDLANPINLAIGPVIHFWDGLLQITFGKNLSVEEKPWYWGVGLSFVELASKATEGSKKQ